MRAARLAIEKKSKQKKQKKKIHRSKIIMCLIFLRFVYRIWRMCRTQVGLLKNEIRWGHSIAPKTTSAHAASASP